MTFSEDGRKDVGERDSEGRRGRVMVRGMRKKKRKGRYRQRNDGPEYRNISNPSGGKAWFQGQVYSIPISARRITERE